ncbi:MAG: hypothetical protein BGP16_13035 [Sphingobium sp. 66-54]|nr:MAG: hypothetical protein BGP16_13035 [Sphingobium sp. 66-54]
MSREKTDGRGARPSLDGCCVLVAEDEYLVAREISSALRDHGADILGPCPELEMALRMLDDPDRIDGAIVDLNLRGRLAIELAEALQGLGIGFVIATGYDASILPPSLCRVPRCTKPFNFEQMIQVLHREIVRETRH